MERGLSARGLECGRRSYYVICVNIFKIVVINVILNFRGYYVIFIKIKGLLCYSFLKCNVCGGEAQKVDQALQYKQKWLLVLADY